MIKLRVNSIAQRFNGDPQTPLLWYLRDTLGLTGTKYGCGVGLCGAGTVHQNGNAIRACITPVANLEEADITTIEGLGKNGIHVVQKAWMEHDVPQCGYCQPGQIMSAAALLASNSKPSDDDIDRSMSGNICRCGTYQRIRTAIKAAAEALA